MLVPQLCLTVCDPVDCSPPDFFVHEILLARILEWVAIPFSKVEAGSPALQADSLPSEPPRKPRCRVRVLNKYVFNQKQGEYICQDKLVISSKVKEFPSMFTFTTIGKQYFGHVMWRAYTLGKTLMLGKIEGRKRSGWQSMRWLDGIINLTNMNLRNLQETVKDMMAWSAAVHGVAKSWTQLRTEQQ